MFAKFGQKNRAGKKPVSNTLGLFLYLQKTFPLNREFTGQAEAKNIQIYDLDPVSPPRYYIFTDFLSQPVAHPWINKFYNTAPSMNRDNTRSSSVISEKLPAQNF